ncbi:hypothetical protein [Bradyrhizobium forestalis]|nr:hypothetical protein [Bradyrhizobium forestalis]
MSEPTDCEIELMTQLLACLKKEQDRAIFTAIGIALSGFARLEENLVTVAATLLGVNKRKVGLILYSIINFQTWLSIIDQLFAEDEIYGALAPQWTKISSGIRAIKDDRDRFAHHSALGAASHTGN